MLQIKNKNPLRQGPGQKSLDNSVLQPAAVAQDCNLSTSEVEAGGSGAQGEPQLHNELETSLGYY